MEFGHVNVPQHHSSRLGYWLSKQRTAKLNGDLTLERVKKLESLGVVWNAFDLKWEQRYEELLSCIQEHGQNFKLVNIPVELSTWIGNQKRAIKKGAISNERLIRLQKTCIF